MKKKVDLESVFLGVTLVVVVALVLGLVWYSVKEMSAILTTLNI
jgi:hypothetical protein